MGNKQRLEEAIDSLQAEGQEYDSFHLAFDILDYSLDQDKSRGCNAAILFFANGDVPDDTEKDVIDLIKTRKASFEDRKRGKPVTIFTHSIGRAPVHNFLRQIACSTNGVWSKNDDKKYLVDRLSSYYRLFAVGLGAHANRNFSTWVEPFKFATGNWNGTAVSAPVYDRRVEPHVFLGVVGYDITLAAMGQTLG